LAGELVQFLPPVPYDTGEILPVEIEQGDFDNDGVQDLAVRGAANGAEITFLIGDGAGRLLKDQTFATASASGFTSGDFNADGLLDLAVTQAGKTTPDTLFCNSLFNSTLVFLGTRAGGYSLSACLPGLIASHALTDAAAGDFNGDTLLDLVVTDRGLRGLRFYPGRGDGTFGAPVAATNNANLWVSGPFTVADIDRDQDLDVVARTGIPGTAGGIGTFFNNGAGQFAFSSTAVPGSLLQRLGILAFDLGDANGDGILDVVGVETSTSQSALFVATGHGDGIGYTLSDGEAFPFGLVDSVRAADFNDDGALDVVAVHQGGNALHLHLGQLDNTGNPNGTLDVGTVWPVGFEPRFAAIGDWNRDSWPDVAVVDRNAGNDSRTWVLQQVPPVADTAPPTVELTFPAPGARVSGVVTIAATAADTGRGVARVEFYRDSILIGSDTTDPFSIGWDTATEVNGPHTLVARAFDKAQNSTTSADVVITVDNADTRPPSVDLTAPGAGSIISGQVPLSANATDDVGVDRVEFYAGIVLIGTDTAAPSPFVSVWDTDAMLSSSYVFPAGNYTLTARAYDAAGNQQTSPGVAVIVDRAPAATAGPPQTLEATSPLGAEVALAGRATDPDAGDVLSFQWTKGGQPIANGPSATITLPLGEHTLELSVTDSFGLSDTDTVSVSVRDTTAPALALPPNQIAPATSPAGAIVTFAATASDAVDTAVPVACMPASGTTFPVAVTIVNCTATDDAGNPGTGSFTVTVTEFQQPNTTPVVEAGAPQTLEATAATGAVVTVSGVATDADEGDALTIRWTEGAQVLGTAVNLTLTLPVGAHTLMLTATDLAGTSASDSVLITVQDTTPPSVSLTCPLANSSVSQTTAVCASATDAVGIARVEFLANGASIGSSPGPDYRVSWNTTALPNGTVVTLRAQAFDRSGLSALSSPVTVTVTTTASGKEPENIGPEPPKRIQVGQLLLHQFVASGSTPLTWSLSRAPFGMAIDPATGLLSWLPSPGQMGSDHFIVRVANAHGSESQDFEVRVVDAVPPSPPGDLTAIGEGRDATLSWSPASDNVRVSHYLVYAELRTNTWKRVSERVSALSIELRDLKELRDTRQSSVALSVTAVDPAGNESTRGAPVEIQLRAEEQLEERVTPASRTPSSAAR
jgi:hypothetical protein